MTQPSKTSTFSNSMVNDKGFFNTYNASNKGFYDEYVKTLETRIKETDLLIGLGPELEPVDRRRISRLLKRLQSGLSDL